MSSSVGIYIEPHTNYVGIGTTLPQTATHIQGDTTISGTLSSGTGLMYRNRIINGDMRIDQQNGGDRGVSGLTGSYLLSNINPTSFTTVDRFSISTPNIGGLTAKQVSLTSNDIVATGGNFTKAVEVSLVPKDGLVAYYPFNSNISDESGYGITLTPTGTMRYGPPVMGSASLYLANTAGVAATNYVTGVYTFPSYFTVSVWACFSNLSTQHVVFATNSTTGAINNSLWIRPSGATLATGFYGANTVNFTTSAVINTWYHLTSVYSNGTLYGYLNGEYKGSTTGTLAQSNFILGDFFKGAATSFLGFIDDFRIYNRALSASEIAALARIVEIGQAPDITFGSGLTTWLKFDGNTTDTQGSLGAPTVTGTAVYTPVSKVGTNALDLTANTAGSSTISVALTYGFTNSTLPISIAFWMNVTSIGVNYQIPITLFNNTLPVLQFYFDVGGFGFGIWTGTTTQYIAYSTGVIKAGRWHHVCGIASYNTFTSLYIDGMHISTNNTPTGVFPTTTFGGGVTSLKIGSRDTSGGYAYKGLIDDVRIYNRVLTPGEVAGLYASSQYASYSLFQQTLEGVQLGDFGWGTPLAQPVTASMWIKNNTPNAQQLSISANNGGSGMLAWIDFEGSSYADKLGFLNTATAIGTITYATTGTNFKVGTSALDLTANTAGSSITTGLTYNFQSCVLPMTISIWINPSVVNANYQAPIVFGAIGNIRSFGYLINSSGTLFLESTINGVECGISGIAINAGSWTQAVAVFNSASTVLFYINGILVGTNTTTGSIFTGYSSTIPITSIRIGGQNTNVNAFKGYIDDVRIYNYALSAAQVAQLYTNNATSTVVSNYLTPRSYVALTPSIPAGAWQKVSVVIPGDTTGQWMTNRDLGLNLALCLGASGLYTTSNVGQWQSLPNYAGNSLQLYGGSSNNFMGSITNSMYVTGVQLEKGAISTPFEFRQSLLEQSICRFGNQVIQTLYKNYLINAHISTASTSYVVAGIDPVTIIPSYNNSVIKIEFFSTMAYGVPSGILQADLIRSINGSSYTSLTSSRSYQWTYKDNGWSSMNLYYFDMPNTTYPVSYQIQFKTNGGTVYLVHTNMGCGWNISEII